MTNADLSTLLLDLANEILDVRVDEIAMGSHRRHDRLKALERRAREAAVEVEKSRELNPLESDLK